MAEIWVAGAITLATTAYGASEQKKAGKKAAAAAEKGSQAAIDEQRRQFDLTQANLAPWLQAGTKNLAQLNALNSGDFSSFYSSPDYAYARDQMQQGIERGAAARGSLYSGGTNVDLANALGGLASQNYNNYYNRIADIANAGQSTGVNLGNYGENVANQIGGQYNNIGNARASAYVNSGNANAQTAAALGKFGSSLAGQFGGASGGFGGFGGFGASYDPAAPQVAPNFGNYYGIQ